ncbi:related to nitrogen metabolic regulation protein nmr [Fusarium torulosum]|uniref:Related to nitrogen metabolic regulation protein nmr n=1 Tax=Fusarium torulosum TaxID=33205 RepID=A0AAE8M3W7_9HYPO|nr:related to nitrogen metabolic regulation protein nmr [Fusarium torulosum]
MSSPKLIVILGATGNQGGSVAKSFLSEPGWKVRAITRNTTSSKAQALSSQGAEVVRADLDDPPTLTAAFVGAHAIFVVSDFWALYYDQSNRSRTKPGQALNEWAAEHEEQQLKNAIDAASKVPTLERFILSSLSNAEKWSKGKYTRVYHFDGKARAAEYIPKAHPELWSKTSIFQAGLFLSNFTSLPLNQPLKNADGVAQFTTALDPETKFPFIAAEEDSGPLVKALITQEPAGHNLIGYREWLSHNEIAAAFTKATGIKSAIVKSDRTLPPGLPEDLVGEMLDCFGYFDEFGYEGRDDPTVVHPRDLKSAVGLETVEDYFKKQDWAQVFGS